MQLNDSPAIALVVTGLIAGGGLLGLAVQRILPERYTSEKARDMIGGVVGQLTLLLVLVNGLLIWTAYGVYSTQQTELQTVAARALEFDLDMRQYGPSVTGLELSIPLLRHLFAESLFCPWSAQDRHLMGLDEEEADQSEDA